MLAFNYTLPPGRGGAGTGDQRSLASAAHKANRTLGSQVWRIWDFGDPYAAKCTTSMAKGINVGVNCNWSEDEFPVHKYQSWDSVYYNLYYMTNEKFAFTKYNETTNSCYIEMIDTLSPIVHRRIFDKTIPHKYTAKLWLRDTINHIESSDEILIDHTKPDASKMTLSSGIPCPFDGSSLNYVLNFKLNTGTQSYFAVNLDSLANPTGFIPYNQGLLAPPAPGSPIPFTLPYEITGSLGDEFVKGYTLGEVGNDPKLRKPNGSFTMGLIVGNGPAIGGSPATCLDTVWYNDFFKIKYMNASFDIVSPAADKKTICAGESAYFNITEPIQNDISVLRWSWGYQGIGRGPNLDVYVEQFKYMEPYTGPSPSRNDKNIAYKGEDWYYNYVIRQSIDDLYGYKTLDTIVTAIVKDWKIETKFNYEGSINPFAHGTGYSEIDDRDLYKLWGDGTFGCIDTTGLSGLVSISKKEYRSYNGDAVITHGNRRYRYTNASKTDSIEIAHILHFRDSSLQGYDTLIVGTDTTFGVWKKQYRYSEVSSNGDTINIAANGPMVPTLFLNNTDGCNARSAQLLNVGFLNRYWFEDDDPTCEELPVFIEDSIRYWQYGEEDPYTYPIKEIAFWQDPLRYSNNIEYHEVDWDSSDGVWNPERSIVLAHQYYNPGNYVITIVAKDSMGCRDTTYLNKEVTAIEVDYSYEQEPCEGIVDFTDQTILSSPSETMTAWTWDFGDGTRKSAITNPTHRYTEPGYFDVNLITWSKFGCVDSIVKTIAIDGPIPLFEYANTSTSVFDTLEIYKSDSLFLTNLSKSINLTNNRFYMEWGDGDVSVPGTMQPKFGHKYQNTGYYMLVLNMEGSAIDGNRCRRSFPDSTNPDHKNVVVHVLPDSTNNISEIERNVMVYPVPADNKLYVKLPPNLNAQDVSVLDMHGKLLKTTTAYESNTFVVDISLLPTGTYVLQLQTEKGIITKRFMIMK